MRSGVRYLERLNLLWIACYCASAVLGIRLLHIQVMRNVYYSRVAESNRTQIIAQTAPRGRIYDRRGEVIATNRPAFSLIYLPPKNQSAADLKDLAQRLALELHQDEETLFKRLREAAQEESAIHLAENLPLDTMFKLSELKTIYPGVDLIVEARRFYPKGAFAGHLLGFMGKMDKRNWRQYKGLGYRVDSWIGKTGIEKRYEQELRGISGEIRMEVDARGRLKQRLGQVPWKPGGNIYLTIDARIQRAVEEALRNSTSKTGGAIVLDPRNGEILAFASMPDFDPNIFLLPGWDEARGGVGKLPEFNRVLTGVYAPGSTFKIVVSAALLEGRRVSPADRVYCPGYLQVGARAFKCWEKKGHRSMDWLGGIAHSCDVYFYRMGLRTGGEMIEEYSKRFHLGKKTGIDLPGERSGNLFGPRSRQGRGKGWYDGDTANLAIGQGELLVTPIQMATVIAAAANRGTVWQPHFVKRLELPDGRVLEPEPPKPLGRVELSTATWDLLQRGLVNVVRGGTGGRVNVPGLVVGGKTGTAQNPHGDDHAWFVAYAGRPGEEPSLAISVLVQGGGHGGSAAGPVARRAIEAAFLESTGPVAGLLKEQAEAEEPAWEDLPPFPAAPRKPAAPGSGTPAGAAPAPGRNLPRREDMESPVFGSEDPEDAGAGGGPGAAVPGAAPSSSRGGGGGSGDRERAPA